MNFKKLTGLIVPVFTPMKTNGSLNLDLIPAYAEYLKNKNVQGVFVNGSSGEGILMSVDERKRIVEAWEPFITPKFKLLTHVGAASYVDCQHLAKHAINHGSYGVSSLGPFFFQPTTINELVEYCALIAKEIPDSPFYYYHIPVRSGLNFRMIEFLKQAEGRIPNFAGIKFTNTNMMDMQQCINYKEQKYDILHGPDEMYLCGLSIGVAAGIGTTYNVIPELYRQIQTAYKSGNISLAADLQSIAGEMIDIIIRYGGGVVAGKAMMRLVGLTMGPCRLPLKNIDEQSISRMEDEVRQSRGAYFL